MANGYPTLALAAEVFDDVTRFHPEREKLEARS